VDSQRHTTQGRRLMGRENRSRQDWFSEQNGGEVLDTISA
jgi:hypothetical protein